MICFPVAAYGTADDNYFIWKTDYAGEFICPQCNQGQLNRFSYSKGAVCKLKLGCDFCHRVTNLTGKFKHLPISNDQTLHREAQAVNVNGWIQRVKLNNNLPLQQSGDGYARRRHRNQVIMYAENGIWYDAVTLLA
ncbi:MAG: DUF928 domain-containing protein [Gloeotrichia echinulata HAB0833]